MIVRRRLSPVLLAACLIAACGPPQIKDPATRAAAVANSVSIRLGNLQRAAIAAEAAGGLSTADTRVVVSFCVSAQKALQQTPGGWYPVVSVAWAELKAKLPPERLTNPNIQTAFAVVDALLSAITEGDL
jgi:hypothetical protein